MEDVVGLIEAWMGECKSAAYEMTEDHRVQTHIEAIIFVLSRISGALDDS